MIAPMSDQAYGDDEFIGDFFLTEIIFELY